MVFNRAETITQGDRFPRGVIAPLLLPSPRSQFASAEARDSCASAFDRRSRSFPHRSTTSHKGQRVFRVPFCGPPASTKSGCRSGEVAGCAVFFFPHTNLEAFAFSQSAIACRRDLSALRE